MSALPPMAAPGREESRAHGDDGGEGFGAGQQEHRGDRGEQADQDNEVEQTLRECSTSRLARSGVGSMVRDVCSVCHAASEAGPRGDMRALERSRSVPDVTGRR